MKVLLINLTRFGDLLQSQPSLSDLKKMNCQTALLCLDNFLPAAMLLNDLDHIFPFSGAALLKRLRSVQPRIREDFLSDFDFETQAGWLNSLIYLNSWKQDLMAKFKPDLIINLTPSLPARILSRYLAEESPLGAFSIDDEGFGENKSPWASILMGAKGQRRLSPFNIVDLFREIIRDSLSEFYSETALFSPQKTADLSYIKVKQSLPKASNNLKKPSKDKVLKISSLLKAEAPQEAKGFIAFQLGASADFRRWPIRNFALLGKLLWEKHSYLPVLLGSKDEENLVASYSQASSAPFISLVGRTNLTELAASLCCVKMLITNDTGTMHLAAGLGLPIISIFLSTAQPFDTGAYLEGGIALEPKIRCHPCLFGASCPHRFRCHTLIKPDLLFVLVDKFLRTASFEFDSSISPESSLAAMAEAQKCRIWLSEPSEDGRMNLRSLNGQQDEDRTVWNDVQKNFIMEFIYRDAAVYQIDPFFLSATAKSKMLEEASSLVGLLTLLQKQGELLLVKFMLKTQEKFLENWSRLSSYMEKSRYFAALSPLWREESQKADLSLPQVLEKTDHYIKLLKAVEKAAK